MTIVRIEESEITFGPFDENDLFQFETSASYRIIQAQGVKIAEFAVVKEQTVWIIEAKSSSPNSSTSEHRFNEFLKEIRDKLSNALILFLGTQIETLRTRQLTLRYDESTVVYAEILSMRCIQKSSRLHPSSIARCNEKSAK